MISANVKAGSLIGSRREERGDLVREEGEARVVGQVAETHETHGQTVGTCVPCGPPARGG